MFTEPKVIALSDRKASHYVGLSDAAARYVEQGWPDEKTPNLYRTICVCGHNLMLAHGSSGCEGRSDDGGYCACKTKAVQE